MTTDLMTISGGMVPHQSEWQMLNEMAAQLLPTGFLPQHIKTKEQAVAIMLQGRELRVPPMYALRNIVVIKGKPSCSAELMLALVQRDFGPGVMRVRDSTNDACTVEYKVPGWEEVKSYTFTIQDAQKANLMSNPTWKMYPAAMLRARCISAVARMAFPAAIGGMYVPGELGDSVTVTDDGEVVHTEEMAQADTPIEVEALPQPSQPPEQIRESVIKLVHAVANDRIGWGHDDLKAYYQAQGFDSMQDMTTAEIQEMARLIRDNPDAVRGYVEREDEDEDEDVAIDAPEEDGGAIEVFPATPDNDAGMDAADMLFAVTLDELVESGSEDVKDWEKMTQMAGNVEEAWVKLWDAAPTRLIANMLLARMREEQMVTDATRDARERARTRMMTVS